MKMYSLYPLGSIARDAAEFWLSYGWHESFENREWRSCVTHFLGEVAGHGVEVIPLSLPPFAPSEDGVEIAYLVGGVRTRFESDILLSVISIHPQDPSILRSVWRSIGDRIGWVHR